jgi:hypothetical protein
LILVLRPSWPSLHDDRVFARPPLGNPSNITSMSMDFPRCDKTEIASAFAPIASGNSPGVPSSVVVQL